MTPPLKGRRAFVTGGSRGIGAGIVRRLAEDGARVVFTYSSSAQQAADVVDDIKEDGGWARAVKADVADPDQLATAIGEAAEQLGGLDILVNNAGIASFGDVDTATLADFDEIVAVNVRAVFAGIKAASPHLTEGGRIVTIGSINGDRSPVANASLYSMSKAAVAGLTRGLARELGPGHHHQQRSARARRHRHEPRGRPAGRHPEAQYRSRALWPAARYRQPGELSGLRRGLVHHRNRDQHRRRIQRLDHSGSLGSDHGH